MKPKHHGGKGKKHGKRKSSKSKNKNMVAKKEIVVYAPRNTLMPFPPKYRTKLVAELNATYVGGGTKKNGHFCVQLNSPYLPFNNYGTGTNRLVDDNATLMGSNPVTSYQPTGYSQLLNGNLYNSYRVHASKIYVELLVAAQGDISYICITPSQTQVDPPTYMVGVTQPLTKHAIMSSSKDNEGDISKSDGALKNYQKVRTVLGLSKIQEEADTFLSATAFNSSNVTSQLYWVVNWAVADNTPLGTNCGIRVRVEYYVTCWNQSTATLSEV